MLPKRSESRSVHVRKTPRKSVRIVDEDLFRLNPSCVCGSNYKLTYPPRVWWFASCVWLEPPRGSNSGGVSLPSIGGPEQPRAVVNDFSGVSSLIHHLNDVVATLLAKCEPVVCSVLVSTLISPVRYAGANFYDDGGHSSLNLLADVAVTKSRE